MNPKDQTSLRNIFVICEGKTEVAYVQRLNDFMGEQDIQLNFRYAQANNGTFANLKKCYREKAKEKKSQEVIFLADWDIYLRDNNNFDQYESEQDRLPPFYFNRHNMEDFYPCIYHLSRRRHGVQHVLGTITLRLLCMQTHTYPFFRN